MLTVRALVLGACACVSASALAEPTTWHIDQPWEFFTANTPPQTNLVGTVTWDRDISNYYPASWSFTLVHFDPTFTPDYPITISGTYPSIFDAPGLAWDFKNDPFTSVRLGFSGISVDVLLDGTQESVAFGAYEYVQIGPNSSQRIINNGTMTLVPAPASVALLGAGGLVMVRRRR